MTDHAAVPGPAGDPDPGPDPDPDRDPNSEPDEGSGGRPDPTPADWLVVALVSVLAGFIALVALAFLPLYIGPVPVPISALLGVAAMILAPRACYRLTGSLAAAVAPVLVWFAVSVWFVLKYNAVLPKVPLTVVQGQWRVMLLLGLGSLAAAATIGLIWADRLRMRMTTQGTTVQRRPDSDPSQLGSTPGT